MLGLHISEHERGFKGGESMSNKPTVKQINFARILAEQLGIEDNYDWLAMPSTWTREEVSELIEELLQRRLFY